MTEINEEDKKKILEALDSGGLMGYKSRFLVRELDLDLDPTALGQTLKKWSGVEQRNPKVRNPSNWILSKYAIGTPAQT